MYPGGTGHRKGIRSKYKTRKATPLNRPIIQLKEKSVSQQPQNLAKPKIALKVPYQNVLKFMINLSEKPDFVIPQTRSRDDSSSRMVKRETIQDISREIPMYPDPIYRHPPKPTEIPLQEIPRKLMDLGKDINTVFEENSPYQEGVILETYQRPDRLYFLEPQELASLINTCKLVQKILLKQADINKILKIIQRKFS